MAQEAEDKHILKYNNEEVYIYLEEDSEERRRTFFYSRAIEYNANFVKRGYGKKGYLIYCRVDKKLLRVLRSFYGCGFDVPVDSYRCSYLWKSSQALCLGAYYLYTFRGIDEAELIRDVGESITNGVRLTIEEWAREMETESVFGVMEWAERVKLPPGIEREMLGYLVTGPGSHVV